MVWGHAGERLSALALLAAPARDCHEGRCHGPSGARTYRSAVDAAYAECAMDDVVGLHEDALWRTFVAQVLLQLHTVNVE